MYFFIFLFNFFLHFLIIFLLLYFIGSNLIFFILQLTFNNFFSFIIPFCIPFCLIFSFFNKNPINTLLLILASFISASFLLFQISSEIVTYTFLIVYIGALMMLFLFVIMLFNLQEIKFIYKNWNKIYLILFIACFLNILINFFSKNFYYIFFENNILFNLNTYFSTIFFFTNITSNGIRCLELLYTSENIIFIFLTIILFFTMLGAITLALSTKRNF